MIYTLYIWSILEFNSNVWFSSITIEESDNIERVQKIAFRIILKENYESYENALIQLNLQTLSERRTMLAERPNVQRVKNSETGSQKMRRKTFTLETPT